MTTPAPTPGAKPVVSETTIGSLLFFVATCVLVYQLSHRVLPANTTPRTRFIYIWHLFDALIHIVFEGSFVYYSFASSSHPTGEHGTSAHRLWGNLSTEYGTRHSSDVLGKLWLEYGNADRRWLDADVGILTLELLTVVVGGPLSLWISEMVRAEDPRRWFWIVVLAVGELYGGWMTFSPEWFTGSQNLDTSNPMYTYLYLFFFNFIWVVVPIWLLIQAHNVFLSALRIEAERTTAAAVEAGGRDEREEFERDGKARRALPDRHR